VSFLFGISASVSNSFGTSTAYRPGSQIVAPLNGPPGAPILLPPGAVQALLGNFEPNPGTAGPSGNPQTINGLVNNYNGQTTNLPPTAGSQAFANFMKFDSILAANAVNQAGILASPGQATPLQSANPMVKPETNHSTVPPNNPNLTNY
jgi:hypothetical protein